MPKNVLVVGMPRSGTSLVSGIFANKGYYVADGDGEELRPPDADNPVGYWEAESLVRRNVEVLRAAGFPHDNTWLYPPIDAAAIDRIGRLQPFSDHADFARRYAAHAPWLWKDPRLCYTLAYWGRLVDQENTGVVLTTRDVHSIYLSFVRLRWREGGDAAMADVRARVASHVDAARTALAQLDIPFVEIAYADFASRPEELAAELSDFAGLDLGVDDLLFERRFDHSTPGGRLRTALGHRWSSLPEGVRRAVRTILPGSVKAKLRGPR